MWSGIEFDPSLLAAQAVPFYLLFQPVIYFVGGINIALLILSAVMSMLRKH